MTEYETIEGSEPTKNGKHEPRTVRRTNDDGAVYMMTEIEDGVFVQWGDCAKCSGRVNTCTCKAGPSMPGYIEKWRDERFDRSLKNRPRRLAETLPKAEIKLLMADVQLAQDAANGDSNDDEISLLRGALDHALSVLGLSLPEGADPDDLDDDAADETPMWKDHVDTGVGADIDKIQSAATSDVRQNVDDGLDKAKEAVLAAKEDKTDVGF